MKRFWYGRLQSAVALLCLPLVICPQIQAHNPNVHSDLTDWAYEIMRAVETNAIQVPAPANVNPVEWQKFIDAIKAAPGLLRNMPNGLPAPKQEPCSATFYNLTNDPGPNWWKGKMQDVQFPVDPDYTTAYFTCGVRLNIEPDGTFDSMWAPQGWYSSVIGRPTVANRGGGAKNDYTGSVLGMWAANVDNEFDDAHIWIRPTNAAGASVVNSFLDNVWKYGVGALLLPFICFGELIAGNPGACANVSFDAADKANPGKYIEDAVPGFADSNSGDYTGMWHFIKMSGVSHNDYDDRQGMYYEDAGPDSVGSSNIDVLELGLIVAAETAGASVNYDKAQGPHRYQIAKSTDGSPVTKMRGSADWQHLSFPHIQFEPVDNLALYGWNNFLSNHGARNLGWPLHALGDATVPHHVSGTSCWGHRPFEDATDNIWPAIIKGNDTAAQQAQLQDILAKAFTYRQMVLAYRFQHPNILNDVPVRQLVTAVAGKVAAYSDSIQAQKGWPYNGSASLAYKADVSGTPLTKANALAFYQSPAFTPLYDPIMDEGVGAIVAFLTSAAEVIQ